MSFDRRLTIGVILAVAVQSAGVFLWAGAAAQRVETLEERVRESHAVAERLARVEAELGAVRVQLDRIERKLEAHDAPCEPMLIEGYASVFGKPDLSGDVVRAGAFTRSLARRASVPLLIGHRTAATAGRWVRAVEDGYGLFVRGLIEDEAGFRLIESGARGLSIGFYPKMWTPRVSGGRELIEVDLVEVSIVAEPMHRMARFDVRGAGAARAA